VPDTRIVLVRHGQTEWSENGRHTSKTDLPLTEPGRREAAGLGELLAPFHFTLVLTSPLKRARETCQLAGYGDRAEVAPELVEWDYGEYEGLTTPQIREQRPDWDLWRDGCPGGEAPAQVGARADRALERIVGAGGDVLVFGHGHFLRVLTARWLEMEPAAGARFLLRPGGVSVLDHERQTRVISAWNYGLRPED
jgi:probable phosphoglycerate mutase